MKNFELINLSGNSNANKMIAGFISVFNQTFPERIQACYLIGSYADSSAVPNSDIDLVVYVRDALSSDEQTIVDRLISNTMKGANLRFDVTIQRLDEYTWEKMHVKLAGLLVFGEDIRDEIILPPLDDAYIRESMHYAQSYLMETLRGVTELVYPLNFPDPQAEFLGYTRIREPDWYPNGTQQGLRELVSTISIIAKAFVNWKARQYVGSKHQSFLFYRKRIGGPWVDYLDAVYKHCKCEWEYMVPESQGERAILRKLCRQTLDFENYFLEQYGRYLNHLLEYGDSGDQKFASERLAEIHFPD